MTADKHLRIEVRSEQDRVILALHGELDLVGAPLLQGEIESAAVADACAAYIDRVAARYGGAPLAVR